MEAVCAVLAVASVRKQQQHLVTRKAHTQRGCTAPLFICQHTAAPVVVVVGGYAWVGMHILIVSQSQALTHIPASLIYISLLPSPESSQLQPCFNPRRRGNRCDAYWAASCADKAQRVVNHSAHKGKGSVCKTEGGRERFRKVKTLRTCLACQRGGALVNQPLGSLRQGEGSVVAANQVRKVR